MFLFYFIFIFIILQVNIYFIFTEYSTTSVTIIQTINYKMISPIIDLNLWNPQETTFSLMNNSKMGNCAIVNSKTKKSIELKTPAFTTKYGLDDKYDLKIKIHSDEIKSFEKFIEFDQCVLHTDKTTLFVNESKKKSKTTHCSMISADNSFINFECDKKNFTIIDKDGNSLLLEKNVSIAKLIPPRSNIICFLKLSYLYNVGGKFGVKKVVTKIQLLD